MSGHQRVGCYQASDFLQQSAAQSLSFACEPSALIVIQPNPPLAKLLA
jgi:hypothetical protein